MQAPGLTPQCKLVQREEWMLLKHPISGRTSPLKHLLLAVPLKNALQSWSTILFLFKLQIRRRNEIGCLVAVFKRNDL